MADFELAFKKTIKHEGGYNDVKGDAGGATNFGVSLRFLQDVYKGFDWVDINNDGKVDATDIRGLTIDDAKKIYFEHFWQKQKCDSIASNELAAKLFDMSVNMGLTQAAKLLQRACNACGKNLVVDGKLGPASMIAIDSLSSVELIAALRYECVQFYLNLVEKNATFSKFLKGWLKRAVS